MTEETAICSSEYVCEKAGRSMSVGPIYVGDEVQESMCLMLRRFGDHPRDTEFEPNGRLVNPEFEPNGRLIRAEWIPNQSRVDDGRGGDLFLGICEEEMDGTVVQVAGRWVSVGPMYTGYEVDEWIRIMLRRHGGRRRVSNSEEAK
jgi:hypothetical protein